MPPVINKETCNGCGKCVDICPADVFWGSTKGELPIVAYPNECWHEGSCVTDCPVKAVKLRIPLPMMVVYK
ncbi:ferredoxin family protein [Chloroflexota bacterium]